MKTKQQWEVEFDEKYCRKCRNPKSTQFGKPIDTWFFEEEITPFEIKAFISSLRKNDIESLRGDLMAKISLLEKPEVADESDVANLTRENYNLAVDKVRLILVSHLSEELKNLD